MRKQARTVAIFSFLFITSPSYAAEQAILRGDVWELTSQTRTFGPPVGKFTPATAAALQQELPTDVFVSHDQFAPTRLVFPGETIVRILNVLPLTGEAMQAYAKVPLGKSGEIAKGGEAFPKIDSHLLFDSRRLNERAK
jgi:hypothetical protein